VSLIGFGDVARVSSKEYLDLTNSFLSDAGAGLQVRGKLYDRNVNVRLDIPFFANQSGFAAWKTFGRSGGGSFAPRWVLTVGDLFF
jgi:hypothetical protein